MHRDVPESNLEARSTVVVPRSCGHGVLKGAVSGTTWGEETVVIGGSER
jgi:hypothetical protein